MNPCRAHWYWNSKGVNYNPPIMAASAQPRPGFWSKIWHEKEPIVRTLIGDFAIFIIFLFLLTLVFLALRALGALGYAPARITILDRLHFYAYLAVYFMFLCDLIGKVAMYIYSNIFGKKIEAVRDR